MTDDQIVGLANIVSAKCYQNTSPQICAANIAIGIVIAGALIGEAILSQKLPKGEKESVYDETVN